MEQFKKRILLIITVMGLFLLTGCDIVSFDFFNGSKESENGVITLAPSKENKPSITSEESNEKGTASSIDKKADEDKTAADHEDEDNTPSPTAIQPAATVDLPLYTVDVNTGETEPITAAVPKDSEITPELIITNVVEAMADQSLNVGIESVSTEKDAIIVSFYKDKAPLNDIGSAYEGPILDAIAMSLIDNLTDYNKVIYRVEGKAYIGSHTELELNEPYLTR